VIAYRNSTELITHDGNATVIIFVISEIAPEELEVPHSLVCPRHSAAQVIRDFDEYNVLFDVTRARMKAYQPEWRYQSCVQVRT